MIQKHTFTICSFLRKSKAEKQTSKPVKKAVIELVQSEIERMMNTTELEGLIISK